MEINPLAGCRLLDATLQITATRCRRLNRTRSGEGWELLGFSRSGPVYSVALAENQGDLDVMWERFRPTFDEPAVDFTTRVVIGFGHAVSGSCPGIDFEGLVIESDRVYGTYQKHDRRLFGGCTDDANPAMFWLAADRSLLPERFTLSLAAEDICVSCIDDAIEVDLTSDEPDGSQWWATG